MPLIRTLIYILSGLYGVWKCQDFRFGPVPKRPIRNSVSRYIPFHKTISVSDGWRPTMQADNLGHLIHIPWARAVANPRPSRFSAQLPSSRAPQTAPSSKRGTDINRSQGLVRREYEALKSKILPSHVLFRTLGLHATQSCHGQRRARSDNTGAAVAHPLQEQGALSKSLHPKRFAGADWA